MKRIYHPYTRWEEVPAGMWANVPAAEVMAHLERAIAFTGNAEIYGAAMLRVIVEWPLSCEHNLTDENINRKAWVGHAATTLAIGCPEHITRMAWGRLSQEQQDAANAKAQQAIDLWTAKHETENSSVCAGLGAQGVFGWDTGRSAVKAGGIEQSPKLPPDLQGDNAQRPGAYHAGICAA